jgi:hypothetical protein
MTTLAFYGHLEATDEQDWFSEAAQRDPPPERGQKSELQETYFELFRA